MKDYIITALIMVIFIAITYQLHLLYPICVIYFMLDVFSEVHYRQKTKKTQERVGKMLDNLRENQELAEKYNKLYK